MNLHQICLDKMDEPDFDRVIRSFKIQNKPTNLLETVFLIDEIDAKTDIKDMELPQNTLFCLHFSENTSETNNEVYEIRCLKDVEKVLYTYK